MQNVRNPWPVDKEKRREEGSCLLEGMGSTKEEDYFPGDLTRGGL